jgi:signal transduction histidine kinase
MSVFKGSLVVRLFFLFLLLSLVPLVILVLLTSRTSKSVEEISIREGSSALIEEARGYLGGRTADYARQINLQLERIESDARIVAIHAGEVLSQRGRYSIPWREGRYSRGENGILWTPRDYGGSNLFISSRTAMTPGLREKIIVTELLDPIMKGIYENDPNTIYVFFADIDNLVRGFPWFDAMAAIEGGTLDPDLIMQDEPLFYIADQIPQDKPEEIWSEVYLDAAGRGWMVTCVTPVFYDDNSPGIVGIDVSLDRIRENVLDLNLGGDGYAFLLTGSGNVMVAPPEAAVGLGWEAGMTPDRFNLLASSRASLASIAREMVAGNSGIDQVVISGKEMIVSYAPVEAAGWSLGLVVSVEEITGHALSTVGQIEEQTGRLIRHMMFISILLLLAVAVATILTYRRLAGPLNDLVTGATKIGDGNLGYRVNVKSEDEIGKLAGTFNIMANSLQKREEELTRVQEKLLTSETLSSMGKVAAAVAHEIRNALGTVKNSTYFLRQKVQSGDHQVQRHFSIIEEEIINADNIVSELLDFTRSPSLLLADVSVNSLLREVLNLVKEKESGSVIVKEDLDETIQTLRADPVKIKHVFYNVIQNSYQAMDGRGSLSVTTNAYNGGARIIVEDSGHGISEDDMQKLFEPFFTTKARGIGLGLSISKKIVEEHGGSIQVKSRPGEGTTVKIELPAHPDGEGDEE